MAQTLFLRSPVDRLGEYSSIQFSNIVIDLLAAAALLAWLTGYGIETVAILVVLLLNAAVGFLTEWEAGRALDALKKESRTTARVRRGGFETTSLLGFKCLSC